MVNCFLIPKDAGVTRNPMNLWFDTNFGKGSLIAVNLPASANEFLSLGASGSIWELSEQNPRVIKSRS